MKYQSAAVVILMGAILGLLFTGVSTHDAMLYLDRQVHGIHCSYVPGMGTEDATGESGCYATMMSPYSSIFRKSIWGGIPVALPGMGVFAFLAFFAVWLLLNKRASDSRVAGFMFLSTLVPVLSSLVMGYLAFAQLKVTCKNCVGVYVSGIVVFAGALALLYFSIKERRQSDMTFLKLLSYFGIGVLFVSLPVAVYATSIPDFSKYIGGCGSLSNTNDNQNVLTEVGPQKRSTEMIEVIDPLCDACGQFEQRFATIHLVLPPHSVVQKFPEGHLELAASFLQTRKGVSASAPLFATGAAADLAALHVFANISFA